jgi:hypothetical protein
MDDPIYVINTHRSIDRGKEKKNSMQIKMIRGEK